VLQLSGSTAVRAAMGSSCFVQMGLRRFCRSYSCIRAPLGFSMDAAQIRRAGLDYWQYVDVHVWEDWDSFAAKNEENDMRFFTKFADSSTLDISDWKTENEYKKPVVLVFGSEVNGFTGIEKWMKLKTKRKTLAFPMVDDRFRSFNLSTTASMALWDAYKSLASEKQGV